jgi:hypothetical protein
MPSAKIRNDFLQWRTFWRLRRCLAKTTGYRDSFPKFKVSFCTSCGKNRIQSTTTMIVPMPPITTPATTPKQAAVIPDSNSLSWFDVPMNKELTALIRPRISSGVSIWTSECLMTTLITSVAPSTARAANAFLQARRFYPAS